MVRQWTLVGKIVEMLRRGESLNNRETRETELTESFENKNNILT